MKHLFLYVKGEQHMTTSVSSSGNVLQFAVGDAKSKVEAPKDIKQDIKPVEEPKEVNPIDSTPAVSVMLSSRVLNEVRDLGHSATNFKNNLKSQEDFTDSVKALNLIEKCTTLASKAHDKNISNGERTYIESEIEFLKQNLNAMSLTV